MLTQEVQEKLREGIVKEIDADTLRKREKLLRNLFFNFKQKYLKEAREKFFRYGEIILVETDFEIDSKKVQLAYRYDPLNDSLVPAA